MEIRKDTELPRREYIIIVLKIKKIVLKIKSFFLAHNVNYCVYQ